MAGTSNHFQVNEKVAFLFEKGGGIIRFIQNNTFWIEDETGFERPFSANEIVKIHGTAYHLPDNEALQINEDDTFSKARHTVVQEKTGAKKPMDVWEIDLHIESLLETNLGMSNAAIAKHCGISVKMVEKHTANAILHIRQRLGRALSNAY